jgi:hypothetical protein
MRLRSVLSLLAVLGLLFVTAGTVLGLLVRHVPTFYRQNGAPEGEFRVGRSTECLRRIQNVWNMVENGLPWCQEFTQEQLNCYLQNESNHTSASLVELPEDVHDVRVAFDTDRIRVGFRYGRGLGSTVISVDLRVWLVAKETNVVALELSGFHAGAVPLGTQALLDFISEAGRRHNIEVTWFRHHNHPVALLHFQANQPRPTILLRRLEVHAGQFVIAGGPPNDPSQPAPPAP